jgi:hypothetical protein
MISKQKCWATKIKGINNESGQEICPEYEIYAPNLVEVDLEIKQPMSKNQEPFALLPP